MEKEKSRKEGKEGKEKTLSPKCIMELSITEIWDIKIIHNTLILLTFTEGWALVFKDLKSNSERKIILTETNECDFPHLFCLPDQNLVTIVNRPNLFGYALDGTLLFRFRFLCDSKCLMSNSRFQNFTFVRLLKGKPILFTDETLDIRKPCSFHITADRQLKCPEPLWHLDSWHVVRGIKDKFGIFAFRNEGAYWWREKGEDPVIKLSTPSNSNKIELNDVLFYAPENRVVMTGRDCLMSYSFSPIQKNPWKFHGQWNLAVRTILHPFLWNKFICYHRK